MTDLFPAEKFDVVSHQDPDKHLIGETLPVAGVSEVSDIGTSNNSGESPFVARADHVHKLGTGVVTDAKLADNQILTLTSLKHSTVTLNDDQAAWIAFGGLQAGLCAIAATTVAGGGAIALFRVGDASGNCSIMAQIGFTFAGGTGGLTGTVGVDGQFTIRGRTTDDRLYIENRTGAQRTYTVTFLSLFNNLNAPQTWVVV